MLPNPFTMLLYKSPIWVDSSVCYRAGCQTLRPFTVAVAAVSCVTRSGANFSVSTASLERYSSMPMYAPHIRRLPSNAERPCRTR